MTADDMVIEALAADEAALRAANQQLIALVADLTFENILLRHVLECELRKRILGDAAIDSLQQTPAERERVNP